MNACTPVHTETSRAKGMGVAPPTPIINNVTVHRVAHPKRSAGWVSEANKKLLPNRGITGNAARVMLLLVPPAPSPRCAWAGPLRERLLNNGLNKSYARGDWRAGRLRYIRSMGAILRQQPFRAFTLIEMLVVITIIGTLAALILAALMTAKTHARVKNVEGQLKLIAGALQRYENDFQDYPPSDGDLEGLTGAENLWECLSTEKKEGPYLKSGDVRTCDSNNNGKMEISDEWNRSIRYIHHRDYGNKNPKKHDYRLISIGPNGIFDNGIQDSDDIVNWNKNKPEE